MSVTIPAKACFLKIYISDPHYPFCNQGAQRHCDPIKEKSDFTPINVDREETARLKIVSVVMQLIKNFTRDGEM